MRSQNTKLETTAQVLFRSTFFIIIIHLFIILFFYFTYHLFYFILFYLYFYFIFSACSCSLSFNLSPLADSQVNITVNGTNAQKSAGFEATISDCAQLSGSIEFCVRVAAGTKVDNLCLGYYDEQGGRWVCQDSSLESRTDANDDTLLCGSTDHFTKFVVTEDPNPVGTFCTSKFSPVVLSPFFFFL